MSGIEGREGLDWAALRAEYVAGGIGQRALAERFGVSYSALRRRAAREDWVALRRSALGKGPPPVEAGGGEAAEDDAAAAIREGEASEGEIALRVRRKLLRRLERMADEIPDGAVTEYKTQDDGAVSLFKLRDLTAAYKELTGDLALEDGGRDEVRVVLDV